MLEIGSLVDGKYKILNEIGHGGMSIVYLAIVERANQTWAIKEVRKNGVTKDDIVQQGLVTEMKILKRLNHAHLPRIIDIIDYDDSFLIVMDYIEGIDLDKKLREGPQKWEDVVEWSKQLCDVFAYLHSRQPPIIYRDMKPGNVKLKPDGNVVLFDFGTAREYKSQKAGDDTTCLGTRGYAAPEQYGGMGQTDARSDIYCLGASMYHLITGQLPGGPPEYIIPPVRSVCPWLPKTGKAGNCVRGLEQIIMKCVQPNPANRYQNCAELMYDLENIDKISDEFVNAQKKKLKTWIAAATCCLTFAIAGIVLGVVADKTVTNSYREHIESAFSYIRSSATGNISSIDYGYSEAEADLINAIKTDPSDVEAWLYLSKLYSADRVITNNEYSTMDSYLNGHQLEGYGKALRSNDNGYARFCYEWAIDLFFLYSKDGVSSGDPSKATPYLSDVVGTAIIADDADSGKDKEVIKKLINKNVTSYAGYPSGDFVISAVNEEQAAVQYDLAKNLLPIAENYESIGKSSGFKEGYSVAKYIQDVSESLKAIDVIESTGAPVPVAVLKAAFYWNTLYKLKEIIIANTDSTTTTKAMESANEIEEKLKNFVTDNSVAIKYKRYAQETYREIQTIKEVGGYGDD